MPRLPASAIQVLRTLAPFISEIVKSVLEDSKGQADHAQHSQAWLEVGRLGHIHGRIGHLGIEATAPMSRNFDDAPQAEASVLRML